MNYLKKKEYSKEKNEDTMAGCSEVGAGLDLLMSHDRGLWSKNISISKSIIRYSNLFPPYCEG